MTSWKGRNVFVTGASGLLGAHSVRELLDRGAHVTVLLRDWVPNSLLVKEGLLSRANAVRGELEDLELLVRALNEHEIDTVLHLGAQTIVGTASRSPLSTFESNIRGTWNVLEAARENARLVRCVVVASSDKAYGEHERLPYTEDAPLQGRFPYDVSKSCTDLIALSYFHTYRLPVAITRCGNLYGGGDLNYNRLIPGTIRSLLENQRPIVRSDGSFVRDYFYVQDAVAAYLDLAGAMHGSDGARFHGQAFNFGTETPLSVLELVERIARAVGRADLPPVIQNQASHEIPKQYLDCAKARAWLGWKPRWTLEQALAETVAWYRAHLAG
ncbi:MAG: GDP-mannose 4,6-dehydratase [Planctomycetes bacterium]|nr:GDP-mannose 4,6-dehydratase [Planctomycetota bacterium]